MLSCWELNSRGGLEGHSHSGIAWESIPGNTHFLQNIPTEQISSSHVCLPTLNMTLSKTGNINPLFPVLSTFGLARVAVLMWVGAQALGHSARMCDLEHLQVRLRSQDNFYQRIEFNWANLKDLTGLIQWLINQVEACKLTYRKKHQEAVQNNFYRGLPWWSTG